MPILEVILKLDAFPVRNGACLMLLVTFGNFSLLCKTSCLHWIALIANCLNKSRDNVAQALANNLEVVDQLCLAGTYFIRSVQQLVKIVFRFGSDDSVLHVMAGIEESKSEWCCFYCFYR